MTVGNLPLSDRPSVLAHERTGNLELPLAIQSRCRSDVAVRAIQLEMRTGIGN